MYIDDISRDRPFGSARYPGAMRDLRLASLAQGRGVGCRAAPTASQTCVEHRVLELETFLHSAGVLLDVRLL
jgi:hypothetical protein